MYKKIENLWEYVRLGIRKGILWSYIVTDKDSVSYTAVEITDNIECRDKKQTYYIDNGDMVLFLNPTTFKVVKQASFIDLYQKDPRNDFFQATNATSFFALAESPNKIYSIASYRNYYHNREKDIMNKLAEQSNLTKLPFEDLCNIEYILEARRKGEVIDFNTLSDMGLFLVSKRLQDSGIPFASLALFYEENFEKEEEMDVEEYIKNTNDIVLITLEQDREIVKEILVTEFEHEMIAKSASVDNMSLEELLCFQSQIEGYAARGIPSALLAKMQAAMSSIDKIKEQMKQEYLEKQDLYGRDDEIADDFGEVML